MKKFLLPAISLALPLALLSTGCTSSEVPEGTGTSPVVPPALQEPSPAPAADQNPETQQAREVAKLREEKNQLLVATYLDNARKAYADGRLMEAENQLLAALERDPGNSEVRSLLDEVQVAEGKTRVALGGSSEDVVLRLQARVERAQAEAKAHAERGFQLLDQGEYDQAIGALGLAQAAILGTGYDVDWGDLPQRVDDALSRAKSEREVALANEREARKQETFQALQQEEERARAEREARLGFMLDDAISAFNEEKYDQTLELVEEVLRIDPLNEKAMELRDTAYRARHERVNDKFLKQRRERFRSWQENIREAQIPSSQILQNPDLAAWAKLTENRRHLRDIGTPMEKDEANLKLAEEIADTRIPGFVVEGETSLGAVIDKLRAYTDIPFVVSPDAVEAVDSEGVEFNLNLSHPLTIQNALEIITEAAGPEVTYTFRYGVVDITTRTKAQGQFVLRAHDVQDLTSTLTDFSGPKIDSIHLPDEDTGDSEESIQGGVTGTPTPILDPANLETLVQQSVSPKTWEEVEGVSITYSNGHLIVWHTPEVQREIDAFLEDMRRYISSMVTIDARFLTIQKDYLQEIGVDFRGLGGTFSPPTDMANLEDFTSGLEDNTSQGLDNSGAGLPSAAQANPSAGAFFVNGNDGEFRGRTENILGPYGSRLTNIGGLAMQFVFLDDTQTSMILRAVEKSNKVQELNSSTISAQNSQRAFITVLNQITYVQDMNVEVAQAALIADPEVGVVSDGIVLDVRPTISHDRKYITLELRPTVASLKRPIPEFTSSLAGLTTPVTLQLPELSVASANTTALIPDGGTVVIAGLKKTTDIDQRAGIPILSDIPILSLLFKAEGSANEKEDVIVIVTAHITDAREVAEQLDKQIAESN